MKEEQETLSNRNFLWSLESKSTKEVFRKGLRKFHLIATWYLRYSGSTRGQIILKGDITYKDIIFIHVQTIYPLSLHGISSVNKYISKKDRLCNWKMCLLLSIVVSCP